MDKSGFPINLTALNRATGSGNHLSACDDLDQHAGTHTMPNITAQLIQNLQLLEILIRSPKIVHGNVTSPDHDWTDPVMKSGYLKIPDRYGGTVHMVRYFIQEPLFPWLSQSDPPRSTDDPYTRRPIGTVQDLSKSKAWNLQFLEIFSGRYMKKRETRLRLKSENCVIVIYIKGLPSLVPQTFTKWCMPTFHN